MAPLTLTILGCGPAAPNPGGACSGYLVRQAATTVLVDCGSGIAGRIPQQVPVNRLSGVAISHLHPDHYFDLVQLYYMLKFGDPRPPDVSGLLPVFLPPGGREFMSRLGQLIAAKATMLEDIFDLREYSSGGEIQIGELKISFHPVQHYVLSHAMRVQDNNGATLVFSSDVGPCPELIEAARDADLLLCESALMNGAQDDPTPFRRGHMCAAEAGQAASQAGARRLVITHYRSGDGYDAHHLKAASGVFSGPVELARDGQTYVVG
jgi:ribonuclease BN (tRNA processing enzyme)